MNKDVEKILPTFIVLMIIVTAFAITIVDYAIEKQFLIEQLEMYITIECR